MMKKQVFLFTVLNLAVAAAAQQVSITLDPYTEYVTTPAQTLTGSVDPIDATLTLNDEVVTVAGDGTFSKAVTLLEGRNPFRFEATRDTYDPAQEDITLFLDLDEPTIRITAPKLGFQTNQSTVTIYGYADDLLDPNITVTRDSIAIPLTDTAFVEDVTLVTGENTFTYEAEDAAGNVAQTYVNIFYDDTAPTVTITSVDSLNFGQALDVTVTMDPAADVDSVTVYANESLIYTGDDGTTVDETITPDPSALEVLLRARVTDVYGNIAEVEKTVIVLHPYWVHGLVLDDATGHVAAGETVSITSPTGTVQAVTDLAGGFATLVYGAPVQVSVAATGYVPVTRSLAQPSGHWRVPDMRLTARSDVTVMTEGATRGAATVGYPSGFSGSARTTFFTGQSLPVLLPVGYSPIVGFELAEASTTGTIQIDISKLAALPGSDPLLVLTQDTANWRVLGAVTPSGTALQTQIAGATNGAYLIAVRDAQLTTAMPAVNDLLAGFGSTIVPAEALADATVFPPSVSILESPSTDFYLRVNGGDTLLSGSLARVDCFEEHDRFDDRLTLPVYTFDVFCYRYGITGPSDLLLGKLDVTCREPVQIDLTLFYLKQETTGMYLEAPASAFPDRTVLSIFNRDKAYSLTETLTTADFRRAIEAEVGDVLDLEARTPDGRTAYHQVDVVIQENGDLIMGSGGFSYPINTDLTLKVDRVMANRDVPVRITTATTTEVDTHLADFPPASEMPTMTGLYAIKIEAVEGDDLPQFEGRLETPLDPQTLDDGDLYLIRVSTGIQAPADPLQPSVLTDHTIASIEDAIRIQNHEVTNKSSKLSLLRLAFEISNYDLAPFNMIGLYSLNAQNSAPYTKMRIRCLRQKKDQGEPGEPLFIPGDHPDWPEINPSWAVSYEAKGQFAAPGIAVYRVRDGISGLIYEFLGISDAQEATVTNGWHYSDLPQLRALDPLTGQLVFVQTLDKSTVRDTMGTPIYTVQRFDAVADPNRVDYDPSQTPAESIAITWDVVDLDDPDNPQVNENQTTLLRTKKKFINAGNRGLRARIKTSFPMKAVDYSSSRTIATGQYRFENSMDYAELILSGISLTEGRLDLEIFILHDDETTTYSKKLEFWCAADPNACGQDEAEWPAVLSTIPGSDVEGVDDLGLNIDIPVYIHFSERVTNIDETTVVLINADDATPVTVGYFDSSGATVTASSELCTLILEPREALKLDTRYEIQIKGGAGGVLDTDTTPKPLHKEAEAIAMYTATFRTRKAPELDLPALTMHSAMTHFRNLMVTVKSEEDYKPIEVQVWDAREPDTPVLRQNSSESILGLFLIADNTLERQIGHENGLVKDGSPVFIRRLAHFG